MSDFDITADLTDGSFDSGNANSTPNGQDASAFMATPPGTVPVQGQDAKVLGETAKVLDKEPSLRDTLSNAFKGKEGEPVAQADAQSTNTAPIAPALTTDGEGKYRNLDGTYASAEQIAAFQASQAGKTADAPVVPEGFTPAEVQQFQSLPAELQQLVARTMEGLNTRAAKYGEYDQLESILGPRREAWASSGLTPLVAVNQLFALSDFAGKAPGDFVLWFAEQHQLDLDTLLDERDAQVNANPADPTVQRLQSEVQRLSGTLNEMTTAQQQQEQTKREDIVRNFALEKDEGGTLKRPYFSNVATTIGPYITALQQANPNLAPADILQKAYESACWADPTVRTEMQKSVQQSQQQTLAEKTAKAKTAGSSIHGGSATDSSSQPNNPNRSVRDEIAAAFAAQSA